MPADCGTKQAPVFLGAFPDRQFSRISFVGFQIEGKVLSFRASKERFCGAGFLSLVLQAFYAWGFTAHGKVTS